MRKSCVLTGDRPDEAPAFRSDRLHSPTFPTLHLTADQIIAAGGA